MGHPECVLRKGYKQISHGKAGYFVVVLSCHFSVYAEAYDNTEKREQTMSRLAW